MTLIDMAIVMMVIGLLAVPALHSYKQWKNDKDVGTTKGNRLAIHKAIADFYFENGFYPCPANPALGPGNAAYGDSNCAGTNVGGGVLAGAVPFATLKIPTEVSLDGWSNKFRYAVSQHMANTIATFDDAPGSLTVRGYQQIGSICQTTTGVRGAETHYVIVSHGPTGVGARSSTGQERLACPAPGTTQEAENCNDDAIFFADVCAAYDQENTASFYDDLVDFKTSVPTRIWTTSPTDPDDIFSNIPNVGINNNNPQVSLDVVGNIRADESHTINICAVNGANCFPARTIGGFEPLMNCNNVSSSNGMSGISNASAECNVGSNANPGTCNTAIGEYVIGIDASGAIICGI